MDAKEKYAVTSLILGLLSIAGWILPLIGYVLTILTISFGSLAIKSKRRGMAISGLVLGIIFLVITIINSILGALSYTIYIPAR